MTTWINKCLGARSGEIVDFSRISLFKSQAHVWISSLGRNVIRQLMSYDVKDDAIYEGQRIADFTSQKQLGDKAWDLKKFTFGREWPDLFPKSLERELGANSSRFQVRFHLKFEIYLFGISRLILKSGIYSITSPKIYSISACIFNWIIAVNYHFYWLPFATIH